MNNMYSEILKRLYRTNNPAEVFAPIDRPLDVQGWGSTHRYFEETILSVKPKVIVEIGVWKGASSIHMANIISKHSLNACVIAVDTWLGAADHWTNDQWFSHLLIKNGYPSLYEQFLSNCQKTGTDNVIIPLPLDSVNAAATIKKLKIPVDIIHIDAGHEYASVMSDLESWWPVLRTGGAIICDDYNTAPNVWPQVRAAIDAFVAKNNIVMDGVSPPKCRFYKAG